jgi:hypothetical protein
VGPWLVSNSSFWKKFWKKQQSELYPCSCWEVSVLLFQLKQSHQKTLTLSEFFTQIALQLSATMKQLQALQTQMDECLLQPKITNRR